MYLFSKMNTFNFSSPITVINLQGSNMNILAGIKFKYPHTESSTYDIDLNSLKKIIDKYGVKKLLLDTKLLKKSLKLNDEYFRGFMKLLSNIGLIYFDYNYTDYDFKNNTVILYTSNIFFDNKYSVDEKKLLFSYIQNRLYKVHTTNDITKQKIKVFLDEILKQNYDSNNIKIYDIYNLVDVLTSFYNNIKINNIEKFSNKTHRANIVKAYNLDNMYNLFAKF